MNATLQTRTSQNPPQVYVQCGGITIRTESGMEELIQTLRTAKAWLKRQNATQPAKTTKTERSPA